MDRNEFNQLVVDWQKSQLELAKVKPLAEKEMDLRKRVFAAAFPAPREGVNDFDLGTNGQGTSYVLKGTNSVKYEVKDVLDENKKPVITVDEVYDAIEALGNEGAFLAPRLLDYKPTLSVKEYKDLDPTNPTHAKAKELIDKVLTLKPQAPTLEVKVPAK